MELIPNLKGLRWRRYLRREPVVLVWLTATAVAMFFIVAVLSNTYTARSQAKASEWYSKGIADLQTRHTDKAVNDFRVALTYWRDNYAYQVSLAKSLLTLNRTEEAKIYLTTLWQRQPEDGTVNLELARLYAKEGKVNEALRFYHNAIYAIWDSDPEIQRRTARIELTEFLLDRKSEAQAEAELIALSGNLPADPALHSKVGDLFMQVPDYERALEQYQESLHLRSHDADAAANAGRAAFELRRYPLAVHYFQPALALNPKDNTSSSLLATAKMVQTMDPDAYRPSKRAPIVLQDFRYAGSRLTSCMAQLESSEPSKSADLDDLHSSWTAMKPRLTLRGLRDDPDLADSALDLVFSIETKTKDLCGQPSGPDLALLLIGQQHEGD